jgi:hypothetical protein
MLLDRFIGAQLIRHVLSGITTSFDRERAIRSLTVLANGLERQLSGAFDVVRNFEGNGPPLVLRRKADGSERAIDIQSPVAAGLPVFGTTDPTRLLVDDLRIRRHLGEEVERIRNAL